MMSQSQIQVSEFSAVYTIVFVNQSQNGMGDVTPTVWVCENAAAYESAMLELMQMRHINILFSGHSHFVAAPSGRAIPVA